MNFSTIYRIFAVDPQVLTNGIENLVTAYGSPAYDGHEMIQTICCGWDDTEHTQLRALRFADTFAPVQLADGRVAVSGLWALSLLAARDAGQLPFPSEELTPNQLAALKTEDAL